MADFKIVAFQNPQFKILANFKILAFENPEFKILADFKNLALENPEFKILADFKNLPLPYHMYFETDFKVFKMYVTLFSCILIVFDKRI